MDYIALINKRTRYQALQSIPHNLSAKLCWGGLIFKPKTVKLSRDSKRVNST